MLKLIQDIPRSWKKTPWLQRLLELVSRQLGARTNGQMTPCALPSGAKDRAVSRREAATVQRANSQLAAVVDGRNWEKGCFLSKK